MDCGCLAWKLNHLTRLPAIAIWFAIDAAPKTLALAPAIAQH
jgi:hypothetical protein